jgi:hypothetical protein
VSDGCVRNPAEPLAHRPGHLQRRRVCVCMCVCVYVRGCVYGYTLNRTHTHTHTHTHLAGGGNPAVAVAKQAHKESIVILGLAALQFAQARGQHRLRSAEPRRQTGGWGYVSNLAASSPTEHTHTYVYINTHSHTHTNAHESTHTRTHTRTHAYRPPSWPLSARPLHAMSQGVSRAEKHNEESRPQSRKYTWAKTATAALCVCVCVCVCGERERERERERESGKQVIAVTHNAGPRQRGECGASHT